MIRKEILKELIGMEHFFLNTIECFTEEDSKFAPTGNNLTVAEQIAHAAQTIEWFASAVFITGIFDMDFEKFDADVKKVKTVSEAKAWFKDAIDKTKKAVASLNNDELNALLPDNPILGMVPKRTVIGSMVDHTAHHRGALAVYARLQGKTPKMP